MARQKQKALSPAAQPGYHAGRPPANKGRTMPAEPLTREEFDRLLRVCSNRAPTGIRSRALLVAGYRCGLRCNEALALYPKDLDLDSGILTVLHGKGDKRRTLALDAGAAAVIARWIDRRRELGLNGKNPLFCTLSGQPLSGPYVRALLHRLGKRAGIEKRCHFHGLRHSFAADLAAEGVPVNVIQAALGHASLQTTSVYLGNIAPTVVIDTLRRRSWSPT